MGAKTKGRPVSRAALAGEADPRLVALSVSIQDDGALYAEDIRGSQAHVAMLAAQGIIPRAVARRIAAGLEQVRRGVRRREAPARPRPRGRAHARGAAAGGAGRARRRLPARRAQPQRPGGARRAAVHRRRLRPGPTPPCAGLMRALLGQARRHQRTLLPGYTHLQRAQPVSLAHHLLAYLEMLGRDRERLAEVRRRARRSRRSARGRWPGPRCRSTASAWPRALGLSGVTRNSLDAVSDRDTRHRARLRLRARGGPPLPAGRGDGALDHPRVRLHDPRRRLRHRLARSCRRRRTRTWASWRGAGPGRTIGDLVALLAVVKGLPLSYNRDLQEDKRPLLDAPAALALTADALAGAVETAELPPRADEGGAGLGRGPGHRRGRVPGRAGRAVPRGARGGGKRGRLRARGAAGRFRASPPPSGAASTRRFEDDVVRCFDPRRSLSRRELPGAPGPAQVRGELARWTKALRAPRGRR